MPDGIIPAAQALVRRFGPQDSSIREMTAAELLEHNKAAAGEPTAEGTGEDEGPRRGGPGGSERGTSERMEDAAPRPRTGPSATTPDAPRDEEDR